MKVILPLLAQFDNQIPDGTTLNWKFSDLPEVWNNTTDFSLALFLDK